jgi:hypothetical protein
LELTDLGRRRETPEWLLRIYGWYSAMRREGELMSTPASGKYKKRLEAKLDTIGWGLLFLLIAALALPSGPVEYASVAAVGAFMIILNLARVGLGVPVRWFSAVLGASTAMAGGGALVGVRMDALVLFFALAGALTIAGALGRREGQRRPEPASRTS